MAYAVSSDYLEFAAISTWDSDADETRWTNHITRAQKLIETYCRRVFEARADGVVGDSDTPVTRKFDYLEDVDGDTLFLDRDLCAISSIAYGDSDGSTLTTAQYVTEPRNDTPYHAIRILDSANIDWTYDSDTQTGIEVAGTWAWSVTPPADIKHATLLMVDYFEKRRTAPVDLNAPAITGEGVVVLGVRIPQDAKDIMELYRRPRMMGI